jgi:hypothetical protein
MRSGPGRRLTAPRDPAEDFRGEKHLEVLGEEEDEEHPDHVEEGDDHDPAIAKALRNELGRSVTRLPTRHRHSGGPIRWHGTPMATHPIQLRHECTCQRPYYELHSHSQ